MDKHFEVIDQTGEVVMVDIGDRCCPAVFSTRYEAQQIVEEPDAIADGLRIRCVSNGTFNVLGVIH